MTRVPILISIRGWRGTAASPNIAFVEQIRRAGTEIVDVHVEPEGFEDLAGWARAVIDELDALALAPGPMHLVTYCLGGNLTLEVLHQLEQRGDSPEFVAFIDVRDESGVHRMVRGLDSLYLIPWPMRFRLLMGSLVPPDHESLGSVLAKVLRRSLRTLRQFPKNGRHSRNRRDPESFPGFRLSYGWELHGVTTPVHLYNTAYAITRYSPTDPSMRLGRFLHGGFVVRVIDGDHQTCIEPPFSDDLIEQIEADRLGTAGP